jgi:hypothetical protein
MVLGHEGRFEQLIGRFHLRWTSFDFAVDFAIGHLLKTPHEITHLITAGMDFGRKARIVRGLLRQSDHPNKALLAGCLNKAQNESKRNIFAHSFWISGESTVTFVQRIQKDGGVEYREHPFTYDEFKAHLEAFENAAAQFEIGIADRSELVAFAKALGISNLA